VLTLEQVRQLEGRVAKALAYIDSLSSENAALRERLAGYECRIKDLEVLVRDFQQDQTRIEEGILHALQKLDAFEDAVLERSAGEDRPDAAAASAAPKAERAPEPAQLIRSVGEDPVTTSIEEAEEPLGEILDGEAGEDEAADGESGASDPGELDIF
jgi:chromosome segregation ATPase